MDYPIDDVIGSQNKSKVWIATIVNICATASIKTQISEILMAISLTYSTIGITLGKKVCIDLKAAAILKMSKYSTQL